MDNLDQGFLTGVNLPLGGKFDLLGGKFCQQKIQIFTYYNRFLLKGKYERYLGVNFILKFAKG